MSNAYENRSIAVDILLKRPLIRRSHIYLIGCKPCCYSQTLLSEGVDVNILDYKGATPLHRAKDAATVEVNNLLTLTVCIVIVY